MTMIRVVPLALITLLLATPASLFGQHAAVCDADTQRESLRYRIESLMLSDDAESADELRELNLPRIHPDSIVPVDDEALCERAAKVYYRYRLGPRPLGGVSMVRVGNRYVVLGYERAGEWTIMSVYTLGLRLVASMGT